MQIVIDPKVGQPAIEAEVLKLWADTKVFERLVEQNKGGKPWTMVDGPVTANNRLGVHHGWGRTYKDVFQRFQAMRGHHCKWQNGFDCQGLWVEVEVEKDRGLKGPKDIEDHGVAAFTAACRKRVDTFAAEIIDQSKLLGQWADWDNSYRTDSAKNITHIWNFLKKCHDTGLLYEGYKVMPWCTRCGTSLSHHEMADSYKDRTDPAINFLCPLDGKFKGQHFMAWTTTPWTVPANTALAVHPDMTYVLIGTSSGLVWMSQECKNRGMAEVPTVDVQPGSAFLGCEYTPPYKIKYGVKYIVVPWTGIDKDTGSGIVHIAPAFGADDFDLWKKLGRENQDCAGPYYGFHNFVPVDENGVYTSEENNLLMFKGQHWLKVNKLVVGDLMRRQLLVAEEPTVHRYPHCWRCHEPVIFRQSNQWFLAVTKIRDRLIAAAKTVEWKPEYILQHMVNWLENMGDWCISRRRYWGLPLPFFKCEDVQCGQVMVCGSIKDLSEASGVWEIDLQNRLHKPEIDEIKVKCLCGKLARRVKEVGDCWLDAGIVPFSTFDDDPGVEYGVHFPHDFAVEMREQVRLWFYSTLVMSVVLRDEAPFKTVMTYDEMRDGKGEKFSKTKGNAPSLDGLIREHGADVLRYALASAPTGQIFQFGDEYLKLGKKFFNTLWNTAAYFAQAANAEEVDLLASYNVADPLDRWIMCRLARTLNGMAVNLNHHDTQIPVALLTDFVNDLSTWYVRLRRPLLTGDDQEAKANTIRLMYDVLVKITTAMAPLFPFTAEALYQRIVVPLGPDVKYDSVHLNPYPEAYPQHFDKHIIGEMMTVRHIAQAGHALRNAAKIKVRQPLQTLYVEGWKNPLGWQKGLVCQEVNVLSVNYQSVIPDGWEKVQADDMTVSLDVRLNDHLLQIGAIREFMRAVQSRRKELGLVVGDPIALFVVTDDATWTLLDGHKADIFHKTTAKSMRRFDEFANGENFQEVDVMESKKVKFLVVKTK